MTVTSSTGSPKRLLVAFLCLLVALAPGCGSLLGYGFSTTIRVNSEPGAQVLLDGNLQGTAPCQFELGYDKQSYRLTVRKEGFQDASTTLTRITSVNIVMLDVGLSFFTFCLPLIIDGAFGNWYYYAEKNFNLPMKAARTPLEAPGAVAATGAPAPVAGGQAPGVGAAGAGAPAPGMTPSPSPASPVGPVGPAGPEAPVFPVAPAPVNPEPTPASKFCTQCGSKQERTAAFCGNCGAKQ